MSLEKRILVVEDEQAVRDFTRDVLKDEGYDVAVATNGNVALKEIARRQPDLILLDLWMPVCDGRKFLELYRQIPGYHAPIIIFSAGVINSRATPPLSSGVVGFLPKPFDLDDLLTMVKKAIDEQNYQQAC